MLFCIFVYVGNQVECASYNINEELCGKYITKYNSNNNLIEEIHYDSIGNTIEKIYCLNNDGKLVISDIDTLKRSF